MKSFKRFRKFRNFLLIPFFAFFLFGCATTDNKTKNQVKDLVTTGDYKGALEIVQGPKFYPEQRSRLLKLVEEGSIQVYAGNYLQATKLLAEAQDLSDKLYTVSISKKISSVATNSNADNFYGEIYERSLIRFYQALAHFMLYQKGEYEAYERNDYVKDDKGERVEKHSAAAKNLSREEKIFHLRAARANILEWDSLLSSYQKEYAGKSAYKNDLSAKIFGAIIHEEMESSSDRQIAKQLYQDAKQVLYRNYNAYDVFNKAAKDFRSDYKKLPEMDPALVEKKYIQATDYQKRLQEYIDERMNALGKGDAGALNVNVILHNNFIVEKTAKKVDFPIPVGGAGGLAGGGILSFTLNVLRLSQNTTPTITFEIPEIQYRPTTDSYKLIVKNIKSEVVSSKDFAIMNPLTDLAFESYDVAGEMAKVGARLVVKHVAAIITAYGIYQSMKEKGSALAAEFAAAMSYAAANKAIAASEKADLRSWMMLPNDIRINSLKLNPGEYEFVVEKTDSISMVKNEISLGKFQVEKGKTLLINRKL